MTGEYSKAIGPGAMVNLEQDMGGSPLRDFVKAEWFEPLEENQS